MGAEILQLTPAPEGLRAIFYTEEPDFDPVVGESVVALALVKDGSHKDVIAVVLDPDGVFALATEDADYLGVCWTDTEAKRLLAAEVARRHPKRKQQD